MLKITCSKCGKEAIIKERKDRTARFYACPGYPKCSGETCNIVEVERFSKGIGAEIKVEPRCIPDPFQERITKVAKRVAAKLRQKKIEETKRAEKPIVASMKEAREWCRKNPKRGKPKRRSRRAQAQSQSPNPNYPPPLSFQSLRESEESQEDIENMREAIRQTLDQQRPEISPIGEEVLDMLRYFSHPH
jgi:ssDNA-binding Zn-finger/Zn-ribbon topoisomerase 1